MVLPECRGHIPAAGEDRAVLLEDEGPISRPRASGKALRGFAAEASFPRQVIDPSLARKTAIEHPEVYLAADYSPAPTPPSPTSPDYAAGPRQCP